MEHTACLVMNFSSISGGSKNIGSQSRPIYLPCLPCFGRLLIDPARLGFENLSKALVEVDFL
jgi:hypothetical protein